MGFSSTDLTKNFLAKLSEGLFISELSKKIQDEPLAPMDPDWRLELSTYVEIMLCSM